MPATPTTMKPTVRKINLENVAGIERLSIPVPTSGGVVILRGGNGLGKTEALNAISNLLGADGKPPVRDGQRQAQVSGLGVQMTVGRSAKRQGELEVESLESRLSIGDLADPMIKDPEAADAKRIKALVQLSGVKADAELFVPLLGDRAAFDAVVPEETLETDDLLTMAGRVKRAIEAVALREERAAKAHFAEAEAKKNSAPEAEDGESDAEILQEELEAAILARGEIDERARQIAERIEQAADAKTGLAALVSTTGLFETQARIDSAQNFLEQEQAKLDYHRKRLDEARLAVSSAQSELDATQRELFSLQQRDEKLKALRDNVDSAAGLTPIPESELQAAAARVQAAREASERGAKIRQHAAAVEAAAKVQELGTAAQKRAEKLRHAARGTDDVLSSLVARCGSALSVEAGRLMTPTKRGKTPFAELSEGERYKLAIDIAVNAFKADPAKEPLLVLPGHAWVSLQPANQKAVQAHAVSRNAVILVECPSDDESIVAEVF